MLADGAMEGVQACSAWHVVSKPGGGQHRGGAAAASRPRWRSLEVEVLGRRRPRRPPSDRCESWIAARV